jgi:hypothetical protein
LQHDVKQFDVLFWEAHQFEGFFDALTQTLKVQSADVLWYTHIQPTSRKRNSGVDAQLRPMLNNFVKEEQRCVFVSKDETKAFSARVVNSSCSFETGAANQRSTGFLLMRDIIVVKV